jgi:hypothetical protein
LSWAASVADCYHRPHTVKYERLPRIDWRTSNRREAAISIIRLCEQAANGNGGAGLLFSHYVEDVSWHSFTAREQRIIAVTARAFAKALREAGFLPGKG